MDDGVFFRKSYLGVMSSGDMLDIMKSVVSRVASAKKWGVDDDNPNCCRIILPGNKHIDLPVYKIDDDQMIDLVEQQRHRTEFAEVYEKSWGIRYFGKKHAVLLANEGDWIPSDPRETLDWVARQQMAYGMPFTHVCRYLKAWRDFQWKENSPLSSIAIMAVVAQAFKNEFNGQECQEDDFLFYAAQYVGDCLDKGIKNPIYPNDTSENLDAEILPKEKAAIKERANSLAGALENALHHNVSTDEMCRLLREHFGGRFPKDGKGCKEKGHHRAVPPAVVVPSVVSHRDVPAQPLYGGEK